MNTPQTTERNCLGPVQKTQRGFERIAFKDLYGAECSLQQSSLATLDAIWLGCERETILPVTHESCGARMHLDRSGVAALIPVLTRWLATGSFDDQTPPDSPQDAPQGSAAPPTPADGPKPQEGAMAEWSDPEPWVCPSCGQRFASADVPGSQDECPYCKPGTLLEYHPRRPGGVP
jgi:hypothetical protein